MINTTKVIFFIGPSSSGKNSFFSRYLEQFQINPITLLTTRPIREVEVDEKEYCYIKQEKMD